MFYKIGKDTFKFIINFIHSLQVILVFLACFVIVYWILQIAQVHFIVYVAPLFEAIKYLIHLFYNRQVFINGEYIDFSFMLASVLMILIVGVLYYVIEIIQYLEKLFDRFHENLKQHNEDLFNMQLEKEMIEEENKNNQIVAFILFSVKNLQKDKIFDADANNGVEQKEKEVLFDYLEALEDIQNCRKELDSNGILMKFKDFPNENYILDFIKKSLQNLVTNYREDKWEVTYSMALDVCQNKTFLDKTYEVKALGKIKLPNEILCPATFVKRYNRHKIKKYRFTEKGLYNLNGENREVYSIQSMQ